MIWNIFIAILLIYSASWVPYVICFYEDLNVLENYLDYSIDFFFFIDVILTFFTVVLNKKGIYETNLKTLAILYLKGWFFVDLTTSIPFYVIDILLSLIIKNY